MLENKIIKWDEVEWFGWDGNVYFGVFDNKMVVGSKLPVQINREKLIKYDIGKIPPLEMIRILKLKKLKIEKIRNKE